MSSSDNSREAIDVVLKLLTLGVVTGTMLAAPNAVQILDKPLNKLFSKLDEREKKRKLSKLKSYLKTQGLVRGDYDHGLTITKKGQKRLKSLEFKNLKIETSNKWDHKWRIIMFDIPEDKRDARIGLTQKIKELGFQILQQSVWIYPYDCRDVVQVVTAHFGVTNWVTYIETGHIDNEDKLKKRFSL